jgi:hypothetical protein
MGSGFVGDFHRRFSLLKFAVQMCSAWEECRAEEDLSVPGEGKKIPAVTDIRYSHGMFEISELERQGFYPLFFKICLHQKKYIVLLEFE